MKQRQPKHTDDVTEKLPKQQEKDTEDWQEANDKLVNVVYKLYNYELEEEYSGRTIR